MSAVTSKVRIYDLAKDLKIDTKRLIEEVRREGVDVSVPSNSISKELAEKIRDGNGAILSTGRWIQRSGGCRPH